MRIIFVQKKKKNSLDYSLSLELNSFVINITECWVKVSAENILQYFSYFFQEIRI